MRVVAELADLDEEWLRIGEKEKLESYLDIKIDGSGIRMHQPSRLRDAEDLQEYRDLIKKVERKTGKSIEELVESAERIYRKIETKHYSDFDHSWKAIAKIPLGALGVVTGIGSSQLTAFYGAFVAAVSGLYLTNSLWEVNPIAVSSKKQLKKLLREEGIPGRLVRYFDDLHEIEVRL